MFQYQDHTFPSTIFAHMCFCTFLQVRKRGCGCRQFPNINQFYRVLCIFQQHFSPLFHRGLLYSCSRTSFLPLYNGIYQGHPFHPSGRKVPLLYQEKLRCYISEYTGNYEDQYQYATKALCILSTHAVFSIFFPFQIKYFLHLTEKRTEH